MRRYEIKSPRERKDGKTYWQPLGSLFVRDDGSVGGELDALPIPDKDGRVRFSCFEPRERDAAPPAPQQQQSRQQSQPSSADLDDDVPF
jgi:hypothetical protein